MPNKCATLNQYEVPEHFYRPSHGRSQCWYVRLVPPRELRGHSGVKEFRRSTGTADIKRAKVIGAQLLADKRREWALILSAAPQSEGRVTRLTPELVDIICQRREHHWLAFDDQSRFGPRGLDEESLASWASVCEDASTSSADLLRRGPGSTAWSAAQDTLDFWCWQIDLPVSRTDPRYLELLKRFAAAELAGTEGVLTRNKGKFVATPTSPGRKTEPLLSEMTQPYLDYKKNAVSSKHAGSVTSIWRRFVDATGDIPIGAVTSTHVYDFLDSRMRDPVKPWSMQTALGLAKRSLREVFALARAKGVLVGSNPIDALDILPRLKREEEVKRLKPRHPFSDDQLNRLFASHWYDRWSRRWRGKMGEDLGARYWVPLVCLYHGNRVREVLQLVSSDINTSGNTILVHFRAELAGEQPELRAAGVTRSVKNEATERVVPLHPALVKLGFVQFVLGRRQAGGDHALLFPSSLPEQGGKTPVLGRAYEQAFLRFVRDELAFGHGFGNHSFRHQLEDRIRHAQRPGHQWPAGMAQAYTGRKRLRKEDVGHIETEGSEAAYGRGHGSTLLLEYVKTLNFDGVTLPPPFAAWIAGAGG